MEWSASQQNRFTNRCSQDSAVGSYKNSFSFQDSQGSGLSQLATQDLFSQNVAAPQIQCEPNKPSSMYEKWKSRQSMMKRDSSMNPINGQVGVIPGTSKKAPLSSLGRWDSKSSINSLCTTVGPSNNRGKPVDHDERKLMDQMICTIKDCNNEVKSTLIDLMDHLDKRSEFSNGQLAKSMSSFLENIWAHEETLKKVIQEQSTTKSDLSELEAKLSKKDGKISNLEEQLAEVRKDDSQRYTDVIKSEIQSFQSDFMSKLKQFEALVTGNEEKQSDFLADCFNNIHAKQKQNEALCKSLKNGMKDSEKRIGTDVSKFLQKMESKTISQQKESTVAIKNLIETQTRDVRKIVISDCIQRQDLDNWATNLENTLRKGFKDMLHSLEQMIEISVKANEQQNAIKRKVQVKNVGTFTEDVLMHQRSNSTHQRGFDDRQPDRSSNNANHIYYPSDKLCVNEHINNKSIRSLSVQGMHYDSIPQLSNKTTPPVTRSTSQPYRPTRVGQGVLEREWEEGISASSFQQELCNVAPTNRNSFSEDRNSVQDLVHSRMTPFVNPLRNPFSYRKGPSPCAVVVPQRQATDDQTYSDQEKRANCQMMSANVTKTKNKKRRKYVYTAKKKPCSKKKCPIEGLTTFNESPLQAENERSQRATLLIPHSEQTKPNRQWKNQTHNLGSTNLERQVLKTQGRTNSWMGTCTFDPYSFDEPDPWDIPAKPVMKECKQLGFGRPQTRSYYGSCSDKKNGVPLTLKALTPSKSPQSSPSVSVLNMTIQRKVRTPFRRLKCRGGPQGSSVCRVPNIKWQTELDISTPKTLLSDM